MTEFRNVTNEFRNVTTEQAHSSATSIVLIIMAILVSLENATVCLFFSMWSKLRNTTNIFVVSLAISDLFVGVLFVPVYLGTPVGHQVNLYIVTFLLFSSLFNLCGVTYDRYHAILQPLTYHSVFTSRRITTVLVSVWLLPLLFIALPFTWTYQDNAVVVIAVSRAYLGLMVFIVFFTCVAISKVYYSIFKAIKRQTRMTRHVEGMFCQSPSTATIESSALAPNGPNHDSLSAAESIPLGPESPQILGRVLNEANVLARKLLKLRFKKHTENLLNDFRAAKLFAFIILIFIICWLPVVIINFMVAIDQVALVPKFIFDISIHAFVANALVNPLLYTFYKRDYRRAFLKAIGCKRERKQINTSIDLLEQCIRSEER